MDPVTKNKVDTFVKESKEGFNEASWEAVKNTIPENQREAADAQVRAAVEKSEDKQS